MKTFRLVKINDEWVIQGVGKSRIELRATSKEKILAEWRTFALKNATASDPFLIEIHSVDGKWQQTKRLPARNRKAQSAASWRQYVGSISKSQADAMLDKLSNVPI